MDGRTPRRARWRWAAGLVSALAVGCAGPARPRAAAPPAEVPSAAASSNAAGAGASAAREVAPLARFLVLFRRADDGALRVRARDGVLGDEEAAPPLAMDALRAGLAQAADAWNASGVVRVDCVEGPSGPDDLVVSFARGGHGACPAFGRDHGVAHVWPPDAPRELHLDAGRVWTVGDAPPFEPGTERTRSLVATLVHELGHVFGLGHSPDPDAALFGDSGRMTLGRSDLAGIRSLYASADAAAGLPDQGDVVLEADSGARARLFDVAPAGASACALVDTDADGVAELLVWRTDDAGHGILIVYRFDAELRLAATGGPFVAALLPGGRLELVHLDGGLALRSLRGEHLMGRLFDARGVPGSPLPIDAELEDAPPLAGLEQGDVDGDGRPDRIAHGPVGAR